MSSSIVCHPVSGSVLRSLFAMGSKKKTAAWGLHHTTVNPLHIATYAVVSKQYTKVGSNSIAYLPCLSKQRAKRNPSCGAKRNPPHAAIRMVDPERR
ncbi:MAG: hypothetical protein IIZ93_04665 [Acidaminococcaceae bacterium]|nr:hypothetical protein [Acidaminococcaceae bacterium]